jgi:hypothetical protein
MSGQALNEIHLSNNRFNSFANIYEYTGQRHSNIFIRPKEKNAVSLEEIDTNLGDR